MKTKNVHLHRLDSTRKGAAFSINHRIGREASAYLIGALSRGFLPWQNLKPVRLVSPKGEGIRNAADGLTALLLGWQATHSTYWICSEEISALSGRLKPGTIGVSIPRQSFVPDPREDSALSKGHCGISEPSGVVTAFNLLHVDFDVRPPLVGPVNDVFDWQSSCLRIVTSMPDSPRLSVGYTSTSSYRPLSDEIEMADTATFESRQEYFLSLFQCLILATGHPKRLDRSTFYEIEQLHQGRYCVERLISEIGGALLALRAGMPCGCITPSPPAIYNWRSFFAGRGLAAEIPWIIEQAVGAADFITGRGV